MSDLRHPRHLRSRLGLLRCPLATSCLISEALAFDTIKGSFRAPTVINAECDPIVVAEVELGQVLLQVRFGNVLINAD